MGGKYCRKGFLSNRWRGMSQSPSPSGIGDQVRSRRGAKNEGERVREEEQKEVETQSEGEKRGKERGTNRKRPTSAETVTIKKAEPVTTHSPVSHLECSDLPGSQSNYFL